MTRDQGKIDEKATDSDGSGPAPAASESDASPTVCLKCDKPKGDQDRADALPITREWSLRHGPGRPSWADVLAAWRADQPGTCLEGCCDEIDWRARAKAAEALLRQAATNVRDGLPATTITLVTLDPSYFTPTGDLVEVDYYDGPLLTMQRVLAGESPFVQIGLDERAVETDGRTIYARLSPDAILAAVSVMRGDDSEMTVMRALTDPRVRPAQGKRYGTHEIVVGGSESQPAELIDVYRVWRDAAGELNVDHAWGYRKDWETVLLSVDTLDAPCVLVPFDPPSEAP